MDPLIIPDLLATHHTGIMTLLPKLAAYKLTIRSAILDELFVLRFLVSARGDVKTADKHLVETLEWRQRNDALLCKAKNEREAYKHDIVVRYVRRGICGWMDAHHLLYVVRAGRSDVNGLCAAIPDDLALVLLYENEAVYQLLDARTREMGRMCKVVNVIDLEGFSLMKFNRKFPKANGESSHMSAVFYPQLVAKIVMINPPGMFKILFNTFRIFMNKQTLEKQTVCPGKTLTGNINDCPFIRKFGLEAVQTVPKFLGGQSNILE